MRHARAACVLALCLAMPRPALPAALRHDARTEAVPAVGLPLKCDPQGRMLLLGARNRPARNVVSAASPVASEYLVVGDVSSVDLASVGAARVTDGPGFSTVRCTFDQLNALSSLAGVRAIQSARPMKPELDVSALAVGAVAAHGAMSPPYPGYTGKGVILGLVDTGVDWTHGDFRDLSNHSRIQYLWDQTDAGGPNPALYPYGTEWTRSDIEAPGVMREADVEGHGSHVCGIAAGNGAGTGNGKPAYTYVGIAPEADIVVAKTDFTSTGVIDGVSWVFQKATQLNKDAVVNLSLGSEYGPHDGTDPQEIALDALSGPGRLIVKAAGNSGGEKHHGRVNVSYGHTATISWQISSYTPSVQNYNFCDLDAWYSKQDSLTLTLLSPNGQTIGPVPLGYYTPTAVSTPDGAIYVENGIEATQNGLTHVFIEVWDPQIGQAPAVGTWTLRLDNARVTGSARFDGWLAGYNLGDGEGSASMWANWDATTDVTTPGNGYKVITVGAYTTKACWNALGYGSSTLCYTVNPTVGDIAFFSSPGPTRDGRLKPEICAPGFGVASVLSGSSTPPAGFTVPDGVHVIEQGTSMACPHVAGALCVLLQKFHHMSPSEAISRIEMGAVKDLPVGTWPNNTWGYGKLNVANSLATPAAAPAPASARSGLRLAAGPNPFVGRTRLTMHFEQPGAARLRILDVGGRAVREQSIPVAASGDRDWVWDGRAGSGRPAAAGVYWVELRQGPNTARVRLGMLH